MKKMFLMFLSLIILAVSAKSQDTLRQRDRDRAPIQQRDRIHQEDHLMLLDGKLYSVNQGKRTLVQDPVTLSNGTVVNPNGSYQLRNNERLQLRNGECLDMSGNRYLNQNRFNQRRMMTQQEMNRIRNTQRTRDQKMNMNKKSNPGRK
jgi:hypothetical protein